MDQKSWLWKKRSTEKSLIAEKANNSLSRNEEVSEMHELMTEKSELQRDLIILNERLSTALSECNAKDNIAQKQVKIAQEAITGWENAETEAIYLKKELEKVLQQKAASDERLIHLDAALKECMQQLRFVREEQERRVHGAVAKTSEEFEKARIELNEKLSEANKRLAKLEAENTLLRKSLSGKDKVIQDLSEYRAKIEVDFSALMGRVESTEKENSSLKYEIRVLEKELEIRNEEREFTRRTAEVSQKQQMESNKRIAKLESECQRLRVLVRKRLPGPAALTKMKTEVDILNQFEPRRRKSNPSLISTMDFRVDVGPDTPSRRINFLTEQLLVMEEENRNLKAALNKKSNELQFSRKESLTATETDKYSIFWRENSITASSDVVSDDKASCAESWASALVSELEHFKNEKRTSTPPRRNMETSDMNLMDDFAEMEKLAVVSLDYPVASSHHSSEEPSGSPSARVSSPSHHAFDRSSELGQMVKILSEHCRVSQRNPNEVLEELKVAFFNNGSNNTDFSGKKGSINCVDAEENGDNSTATEKKSIQKVETNIATSIRKILEILEGINVITQDGGPESGLTGYVARVFQWKTVELSAVIRQFIRTCNDLLDGKADLEGFAREVASGLDWVMNHCFSLQDVSSMKDAIRNHLDWDESISESEVDIQREDMAYCPMASPLGLCNDSGQSLNVDLAKESESLKLEGNTVDQAEKQKMMKEDLVAQLMETNMKISQLENELENKDNSCKRLEEACNDLKIQLNRVASKQVPDDGKQSEKQLTDDWEITAASEKLAECQETILNLGKQLKALASPRDAALFDKVISAPADVSIPMTPEKNTSQRSSLFDKMLAEDNDKIGDSPGIKNDEENKNGNSAVSTNFLSKFTNPNGIDHGTDKISPDSMAIVPIKKNGGRSFFKKLFWRQRKGNSKKKAFS